MGVGDDGRHRGEMKKSHLGGGGDAGWMWMAEDVGHLCVDLLLARTLSELAEGLAFASRC